MTLEKKYSDPETYESLLGPCENHCCFCRDERALFTGKFRRKKLVEKLQLLLFQGGVTHKELYSFLSKADNRQEIWTVAKSNVTPGMVNALILQLLGTGILCFVKNTCNINWALTDSDTPSFVYTHDSCWSRMSYV